jgi:hypothetical protein
MKINVEKKLKRGERRNVQQIIIRQKYMDKRSISIEKISAFYFHMTPNFLAIKYLNRP